jgi:hypothetical protein
MLSLKTMTSSANSRSGLSGGGAAHFPHSIQRVKSAVMSLSSGGKNNARARAQRAKRVGVAQLKMQQAGTVPGTFFGGIQILPSFVVSDLRWVKCP